MDEQYELIQSDLCNSLLPQLLLVTYTGQVVTFSR